MQKAPAHQDSLHQEYGQNEKSIDNMAIQNHNNYNQLKQLKKYMRLRLFFIMLILVIVIVYLLYSNLILERPEKGQLTKQIQDLRLQNMNTIQKLKKQLDQTKKDKINENKGTGGELKGQLTKTIEDLRAQNIKTAQQLKKQLNKAIDSITENKRTEEKLKVQLTKQIDDLKAYNMKTAQQLRQQSNQIKHMIQEHEKQDHQKLKNFTTNKTLQSKEILDQNNSTNKQLEVAQRLRDINIEVKSTYLHNPMGAHSEHEQLTLPYDTMGMNKYEKFNNEVVKESDYYRFQQSFFDFLKPYNDTTCELERLGDAGDGGYPVCVNYLNNSKGLLNLGIEGRDNFGCSLTSRQNMPNFQFDCTNNYKPYCPTNNNNNLFTLGCLNQRTQKANNQFFSLKEMIDRSNLTGKNFILKIDIQGAQWQGFKTFPIQYLKLADQILMEIHLPGPKLPWITLRWGNVQIMKALQRYFYSVYLHMNFGACNSRQQMDNKIRKIPSIAIEISLVNKRLVQLKSNDRSYVVKAKNQYYARVCDLND